MILYNWHKQHTNTLTYGQRAADKMRNLMGSWRFLFCFLTIMILWGVTNIIWLHNKGFDPFPFILLNLILSTLAGLQGIIILIASKRQDEITQALAQHDYETNIKAEEEIRYIKGLLEFANSKLDMILNYESKALQQKNEI